MTEGCSVRHHNECIFSLLFKPMTSVEIDRFFFAARTIYVPNVTDLKSLQKSHLHSCTAVNRNECMMTQCLLKVISCRLSVK